MVQKTPKTPQEKKRLSLTRDRGGYFYNNNKAARKAVPLRKAQESRRVRHQHDQALSQIEYAEEAVQDLVESSVRQCIATRRGWMKGASEPLGECIANRLEARSARVGRKVRSRRSDTTDR
jgi:hypothetical protein